MQTRHLRFAYISVVALLIVVPLLLFSVPSRAAQVSSRSILISTSVPSATASHTIGFTNPTPGVIGSVAFEYCTNSPLLGLPCTAPAGLSLSGAVLATQTGITGYSINGGLSSANKIVMTRPLAGVLSTASSYRFNNIINPSNSNETVFVRISTYSNGSASGAAVDNGAVVFNTTTANGLGALGYVPPYLTFCVGVIIGPNCSGQGNVIEMGDLSRTRSNTATSQFSGATNDVTGFSVAMIGLTMTSGNNVIPSSVSPVSSQVGASQFGVNLRGNSNPSVGQDPTGVGTLSPVAPYSTPNQFALDSGATMATSPLPTDFNIMTVSYLVNVSQAQPPGVYSSTFTYVATASF